MSITRSDLISTVSPPLPKEVIERLVDEYLDIKKHLVLGKYSPSELNGGRFAECLIRLLQHLQGVPITPFGQQLKKIDELINTVNNNPTLHDSIRFYISKLVRVMLDVRNRRDVAHPGGDVNPNYSDSLLIAQLADWIFIELVRIYYKCPISVARQVVENISQIHVPVIFSHNGFLKVQNSQIDAKGKVLVLLYHKYPATATDIELQKWIRYANGTRFRSEILTALDDEALIHYENKVCIITPKGSLFVEKRYQLEITVM